MHCSIVVVVVVVIDIPRRRSGNEKGIIKRDTMLEFVNCAVVNNAILEFEHCGVAVVYIAMAQSERFYATPIFSFFSRDDRAFI